MQSETFDCTINAESKFITDQVSAEKWARVYFGPYFLGGLDVRTVANAKASGGVTVVVTGKLDARYAMAIDMMTAAYCAEHEEDCIAVLVESARKCPVYAKLVGPRAARWGQFNPAKFIRF